ncbi:4-hydroxy-tetrahydrodipicolinate synthase [Desulfocurvibacter africanus]|uniref:4-hydroxy-tetrahydrodipicolinate synthase n=1 Tax=Desulfocurvibacter africanus subsp. africanus str. Walvis Bay TaxID=690850 RepID=F3Z0T9_DESAF|nr:4-hydroxy-tetrahydrodipicolinate synthase [Desulfocurvibacter africanus]EGJ51017.1 Dihydrodipicolinate synthase [Desulfocurvibacter africanus subsp. africanus str. Walvis Bay]
MFRGAFTALVTPFKNDSIDEDAYRALVEWQLEQGIHGLVPCGTTGESATLSHAEHKRVISICVDQVKGRVPVLAGAGSNNTSEAIELTRFAKESKADGALLITPYYNKPTQEGLIAHFKAIAAEVSMPFIVYNVPGRTATNLLPETLAEMRRTISEVIGVKEATADLTQISKVLELCGRDFLVLSGDDFTVLPTLAIGGVGAISVVSNIKPAAMSGLVNAFNQGDLDKARDLHFQLAPLCRAMFMRTNPIPVKTALYLMGRLSPELRLPLLRMDAKLESELKSVLATDGLV